METSSAASSAGATSTTTPALPPKPATQKRWTKEHDEALLACVDAGTKELDYDLVRKNALLQTMSMFKCTQMYKLDLHPTLNYSPWSAAEDQILLQEAPARFRLAPNVYFAELMNRPRRMIQHRRPILLRQRAREAANAAAAVAAAEAASSSASLPSPCNMTLDAAQQQQQQQQQRQQLQEQKVEEAKDAEIAPVVRTGLEQEYDDDDDDATEDDDAATITDDDEEDFAKTVQVLVDAVVLAEEKEKDADQRRRRQQQQQEEEKEKEKEKLRQQQLLLMLLQQQQQQEQQQIHQQQQQQQTVVVMPMPMPIRYSPHQQKLDDAPEHRPSMVTRSMGKRSVREPKRFKP